MTDRYPALRLWHRELAGGVRTRSTYDALWRAACHEAAAKECEDLELWGAWRHHVAQAHRIVMTAASTRRAA